MSMAERIIALSRFVTPCDECGAPTCAEVEIFGMVLLCRKCARALGYELSRLEEE